MRPLSLWKFVIRIKDKNSNGIASGLNLPKTDIFDIDVSMTFTRQQTKMTKMAGYKFMPTIQTFDYLPLKSKDTYTMSFSIARFAIADDSYEMLVTNLGMSKIVSKQTKTHNNHL